MRTIVRSLKDQGRAAPGHRAVIGQCEVDVWVVDLKVPGPSYPESLAPFEYERASRFKAEIDRRSFVRRRVALRTILGRYLGIEPAEVAYEENRYGKPALAGPRQARAITFNTSHSRGIALIAVARSGAIGVDVERLSADIDHEAIAARFFAANEAASLAVLHPRDRVEGFFNAWTRKEAVVKALGRGLSIPLDSFEVSVHPHSPPAIVRWDVPGAAAQRWRIHHLKPAMGYVGALAVDSAASICHCRRWEG